MRGEWDADDKIFQGGKGKGGAVKKKFPEKTGKMRHGKVSALGTRRMTLRQETD